MSVLVARTRDLEQFQRAVAELDAALGTAIVDPLVTSLDEIRRRAGDPVGASPRARRDPRRTCASSSRAGRELRPPRPLPRTRPRCWSSSTGRPGPRTSSSTASTRSSPIAATASSRPRPRSSARRSTCATRGAPRRGIARRVAAVRPADLLASPTARSPAVQVQVPSSFGPTATATTTGCNTPACSGILADTPLGLVVSRRRVLEGRCAARSAAPATRASSTPATSTSRPRSAAVASARRARRGSRPTSASRPRG